MRITDGTETMEVSVKEYGDHSEQLEQMDAAHTLPRDEALR